MSGATIPPVVDQRSVNLLGTLALAISTRVIEAAREVTGRPTADTVALVGLAEVFPGASQDTLARALGLSQSGATRLVDRLVRDRLVTREPGPDGRTVSLRTTEQGFAAARATTRARRALLQELLTTLDEVEAARLTVLLEKLLGSLVHERLDAFRICRMCDVEVCHNRDCCPVTDAARALAQ